MVNIEEAKKKAALQAAQWIESEMIVGLGSGSTTAYFIEALIAKSKEGLKVQVVCSSKASEEKARQGGLLIRSIDEVESIDITVDGADEIDSSKRMIKGGGGAHVREKILASASKEMVVIVDETKWVEKLGTKKLPVEALSFGFSFLTKKLQDLGYLGRWRLKEEGSLYISDNGNFIYDIEFPTPLDSPEEHHEKIKHLPGVVDTGFFFYLAGRVITGQLDGNVRILD